MKSGTSPVRVLGVVSRLEGNGAIVQLYRCLEVMDRTRVDFTLCCMSGTGPLDKQFLELGIPVVFLRRRFRFDFSVLIKLALLMKRGRFDVVYTMKHTAALWTRTAAMLSRTRPLVTHEAGFPLPFSGRFVTMIDRFQSRWSDLILANSESTKSIANRKLGIPNHKIHVLYNGFQCPDPEEETSLRDLRKELDLGPETRLVGFVGRLSAEKGCDLFLRAMAEILEGNESCFGIVCGDGFLRAKLEDLAEDLGIRPWIRFLGWRRDSAFVIRSMDVLVVSSLYESFCMVLPEAALAKVPVVASAVGGIPEVGEMLGNGVLVPPTVPLSGHPDGWIPFAGDSENTPHIRYRGLKVVDPSAIAQEVERLLEDPGLRESLTRNAPRRVRECFSLESHARQFEDELLRVGRGG